MTGSASRPKSVQRAAICLWISAGLALFMTLAQVTGLVATVGASVGMTAVVGVVSAALLAWMAAKISSGRGWVRWLFAIIYVLGSLASVVLVLAAPAVFRAFPAILQGNTIVQFILQTAALVLIFTSTSRQWFKSRHAGAAP